MQDKEFDDLFRSKLDDFETEPTAQVWINIDAEMDGKKRKKGVFFTLRIAASVIVLLTAGILFIPKKGKVDNDKPIKNNLAVNRVTPPAVKPGNNTPVTAQATKDQQVAVVALPVNHIIRAYHTKKTESIQAQKEQVAPEMANAEPVKVDEHPVLIASAQTPAEVIKAVVPDTETPLAIKQASTNETKTVTTAPVLASTQKPAIAQAKPTVKKRGIHNMGDLVNLVMAKVDKRKDKMIEFTDTDDESTITAVNLGPIKIKKEDK